MKKVFDPYSHSNKDSIVVLEEIDNEYEPTNDELKEYAQYLGLNLEKDSDLLWIATEGIRASVPKPWKPCKTAEGDIFYFNFETGESSWDHPCDKYYKELCLKEKEKKLERIYNQELKVANLITIEY